MNASKFANLSTEEKRRALQVLLEQRRDAAPVAPLPPQRPVIVPRPAERHLPFPLTPVQESFLVAKQLTRGADAVGCHIYLELEEPALDVARLERAWQRLVDHHEMLRASVSADGRQQIAPRLPAARFAVDDLRAASATDLDAHLRRVRAALAHKVYPPDASPLWTIQVTHAADTSIIHLSIDEWIVDAASLNRVVTQWCQLYREPATALPPCELSFRDHVLATRAFEDTAAYQQDLGYWCDKLAGMPGDPALPRPASPSSPVRRRIDGSLDRAAWAALRRKADDLSVSPTALLLTLFAEALAAHSDPGPFSLTLTYFNRPPLHPQIEELIAPLISTHRFLADGAAASVQDRVVRAQRQLWRDVDHDRADAISALRALRGRHQAPPGASRIVFTSVLGNVGKEPGRDGQTWLDRVRHAVTQTPGINLDHQIAEQDGALRFTWDVVDSAFRPGLIDALFATYLDILRAFATTDALWTAPCWRDQRRGTALAIAARPDERHLPFPLTDLQRAYFVGRTGLMANGGVSCQLYQELTLDDDNGDRIAGRVERAWQRLIDAHDMLRAIIQSDGNQRIVPAGQPVDLRVADLTAVSADERARHLAAVRDQMVTQVFPLDRWPFFELRLSRTEPTRAILHLSIDFLIADAVSIHTLLQRFFALYQDVGAPCEAPSLSFRDYQLALKAHEGSPDHGRSVAYWKQRLTDLPDGPDLGMRSLASKERPHRRRLHGALRAWRALQATAARHGVSDEAVLLGVYLDVLATAARRAPFTVVVARWDRPPVHPQIYDIVGDFTAISWIASAQGGTFAERLQQIQRGLDDDRAHPLVSGSRILQQLAVRSRDRRFQTFPVVFTGLSPGPRDVPASITIGEQITQTPQVYLDNISIEACDALQLHWDAVDGIFPDGLIESLFATYCATLERLAVDAEAWHSFDAVATPAKPAPRHHTTLHRLIEDRVARCPDHPAVVFEGAQLTFAELNHRANQVARYLQRQGVAPDRLVGVLFDRSIEMCVALLAILKAGGAYVPIDPTYPQDRIDFLLEDAGVSALLTQERLRLHSYRGPQLCLDSECVDAEAGDDLGETTAPDRIAYVIYTSGSTGKPKGCMIPHDAICNRLLWMQDEYRLRPDDRVLQKTPYTFDVSVWEFFLPWIAGATLVVARPDGHRDTGYLVRLMDEQRITICHFVPSMLNFFLKEPVLPRFLRQVFASGEALPYDLVDTFLRRLDARLHNLYGPTEAAVDVSYWACERRPDRTVPIGRAIANVELLVLDAQRRPVPAGEQGELHIGGVCLARGYLNRPELTRDRFISLEDGTRVYRTGDLARVLDDGNLEYLGRIDSQVKLRGFRIELGEIEAALAGHPAVRGAVVAVQDAGTDDPKLIAYVVTGDHTAPSRALKAYLKQRLPEYMVPNRFVAIPAIPVTAHGKCDRKALPWPVAPSPEPTEIAPEVPAAPAATAPPEVLPALRALFAEALQVATLGDDDDLFDLGATSLTIVRTSQRIEAELQVELPVEVVLAEPTVAAIARYVQSRV
ncbi:MAG TPA: amino acid adenylation domain-containing protein, partial [Kofleriaceae bacterium]|nr:amino acid adenylation domain-containing protein [Kofleriaceae bacterium]